MTHNLWLIILFLWVEFREFWDFWIFKFWIWIFKGGVAPADTTKSSRSFYGGPDDAEVVECPADIDDYMEPPCIMPTNDDGKLLTFYP